jgi:hypothetical protein
MLGAAMPATALAQSKVGVTSATTGGPLGKPPAQAERVLRVGIDVQANEAVRTGANDRAHMVFLDGSSLTVGPQARITIDRFVYDPNSKTGDLAISASQGVLRFVGGKISKTTPVTVTTPTATLTIRGGIMLVSVTPTATVATFLFGVQMTVTAQGQTQVVTRPGWQVVTQSGQVPSQAVQAPAGSMTGDLGQLEASSAQRGSSAADQQAQSSGFSAQNSGLGTSRAGGAPVGIGNFTANAVNDASVQSQRPSLIQMPPGPRGGGFSGGGGCPGSVCN